MDSWVRFNSQSQAKERIFRAAQYTCTLLNFSLQRGGASSDLLTTIRHLEAHMSLTRKLLRLGNSVEALEAAKRSIHLSDGVLRLCLTVSHLNRALYFACDNLLWAGKTGVITLDQNKWSQRAYRYYLFSLMMNLTRDVYELRLLIEAEERHLSSKSSLSSSPSFSDPLVPPAEVMAPPFWLRRRLRLVLSVLSHHPPLLVDLLKNSCDIFIPLDRLGIWTTGGGWVGACGLASSVLSIITILHPWTKLKP